MLKKLVLILGIVVLVSISGCVGPDGDVYQRYSWVGGLYHLYDSNPSTPAIVTNGSYFQTEPGEYYMEYITMDGEGWYIFYELEAEEGTAFDKAGEDSWYTIALFSSGPVLYKDSNLADVSGKDATIDARSKNVLSINRVNIPLGTDTKRGEIIGRDQLITDVGTLKIEYGKIEERK